jgi:RsmE family RNA methyltransferase
VNILFLRASELGRPIPGNDRRYRHITKILCKSAGDLIEAGCSDGTLGEALITQVSDDGLSLAYVAKSQAPALRPVRMLMGFPRPIQAGRLLKDLTSLGVSQVWFALSELGEKSYAESTFFREKAWTEHLVEGAEQAGNPRMPEVRTFWSLERALASLESECRADEGAQAGTRIFFHPDPAAPGFLSLPGFSPPLTLAIGSERGWTERETIVLKEAGFIACSLGDRILKTETAALAAASIACARLGLM